MGAHTHGHTCRCIREQLLRCGYPLICQDASADSVRTSEKVRETQQMEGVGWGGVRTAAEGVLGRERRDETGGEQKGGWVWGKRQRDEEAEKTDQKSNRRV